MGSNDLRLIGAVHMLGSRGSALVAAGKKHRDQLLRALIPLFIAEKSPHLKGSRITSGDTEKFWKRHKVKIEAPNVAWALRCHVGYARRTKTGPQITPNGVRYVEAALR